VPIDRREVTQLDVDREGATMVASASPVGRPTVDVVRVHR
jgi:hypothetical protein